MLSFSTITITLALIFYSIGVWSEQITSYLRGWHVPVFRIGVVFDISGTLGVHFISDRPLNLSDLHTLTG